MHNAQSAGRPRRLSGQSSASLLCRFRCWSSGMRWKMPPVLDAVRRMNRSLTNPRVMRTAGSAGTQTSVIRHAGRTTGQAVPDAGGHHHDRATGFLIALPYGTRADWVRNVLAAGLGHDRLPGRKHRRRRPIIAATAEVEDQIPRQNAENAAPLRGRPNACTCRGLPMDLVDPAYPPSRKAPLVWAIGAAIPWLVLVVAQAVWFVIVRPAWPGCTLLAAAVTAVGIVLFVVRRPGVALPRAPLGHQPASGVHPDGLAGAGAPHCAGVARADRRHLSRPAGPAVRVGQRRR